MPEATVSNLHLHQELSDIVHNVADKVLDQIAVTAFWVSSSYSLVLPIIMNALDNSNSLVIPNIPIAPFLAGISSFITGTHQLTDQTSHRPGATQIKGLINILRSFELTAVTTAPALASLGPPGVAAFVGVSFALSLDDTTVAFRRYLNESYWLQDTSAMLEKNEEVILSLQQKVDTLAHKKPNLSNAELVVFNTQSAQLEQLKETQQTLINDLNTKIQYILVKNTPESLKLIDELKNKYSEKPEHNTYWRNHIHFEPNGMNPIEIENAHAAIQQKCQYDVENTTSNTLIWGLAFVGTVLLCIPGLQIPGAAILAGAGLLYAAKNAPGFFNRFLKKADNGSSLSESTAPAVISNFHNSELSPNLVTPQHTEIKKSSIQKFESLQHRLKEQLQGIKNEGNILDETEDMHHLHHMSMHM